MNNILIQKVHAESFARISPTRNSLLTNLLSSTTKRVNKLDAWWKDKSIPIAKMSVEINKKMRGNLPLGVHFCICYLQFCGRDGESPFLAVALPNLWFKI